MAVLLDTGIVFAYYDRNDAWHRRALKLVDAEEGALIVPAPVIPEADHLIGRYLGAKARHAFYEGLAGGDYFVADLPRDAYSRVLEIDRQYADLDLGFVDSAILALVEILGLPRLATTDRRDFAPLQDDFKLTLLP